MSDSRGSQRVARVSTHERASDGPKEVAAPSDDAAAEETAPEPATEVVAKGEGAEASSSAASSSGFDRVVRALDFGSPAESAIAVWLRVGAFVVSLIAFVSVLVGTTRPIRAEEASRVLNDAAYEGHRYGMPRAQREAIFTELATAELAERERALEQNTWQGHLWSREDDRGHRELTVARSLATKNKVSLTQIYLVLDEGIREKWLAPNGRPLPATTPPQDPRSTW